MQPEELRRAAATRVTDTRPVKRPTERTPAGAKPRTVRTEENGVAGEGEMEETEEAQVWGRWWWYLRWLLITSGKYSSGF